MTTIARQLSFDDNFLALPLKAISYNLQKVSHMVHLLYNSLACLSIDIKDIKM